MKKTGHAAQPATRWSETALYAPVKTFLEAQGFEVKGEICGCDVVGVRDGEPPVVVIAELKLSFTLELVLQAVDRMRCADTIYLAVMATQRSRGRGRDPDARVLRLCRLLGVGLLTVNPGTLRVEVLGEPLHYQPRANLPLRRRLLCEHRGRSGDPNVGGSSTQPIMTAYRQRALACAWGIGDGVVRPRDLRQLAEDVGTILLRNVYGWFERVRLGHYRLSEEGRRVLSDQRGSG
jgi:hypothetical protein